MLAGVSGQVVIDADANDRVDLTDTPQADVRVVLVARNVEGVFADTFVAETRTDAFGQYAFSEVAAGDYAVYFELHPAAELAAIGIGDEAGDSDVLDDGISEPFTLSADSTASIDAAFRLADDVPAFERLVELNGPGIREANDAATASAISGDGRYVLFASAASDLVEDDDNDSLDVFLRDRQTGRIERLTDTEAGQYYSRTKSVLAISDDGRYVAYAIEPRDRAATPYDVRLIDRDAGTDVRLAAASYGPNYGLPTLSFSQDGTKLAFSSSKPLAGSDGQSTSAYLYDLPSQTFTQVSAGLGDAAFLQPQISSDGSTVVFTSVKVNSTPGLPRNEQVVYSYDVATGVATALTTISETEANGFYRVQHPVVSGDGQLVAFLGQRHGDRYARSLYLVDRSTGSLERVVETDDYYHPASLAISDDGRYLTYSKLDSWKSQFETNFFDLFRYDRATQTSEMISRNDYGAPSQYNAYYGFGVSRDGQQVSFATLENRYAGDRSHVPLSDRWHESVVVRDLTKGPQGAASDPFEAPGRSELASRALPKFALDGDVRVVDSSADGNLVLFLSSATNFGGSQHAGGQRLEQLYVKDRAAGTIELVSLTPDGNAQNGEVYDASMTADGRFILFESDAWLDGDKDRIAREYPVDIYVHDRTTGQTERIESPEDRRRFSLSQIGASISEDGRYVAFRTDEFELLYDPNDAHPIHTWDSFQGVLYDRTTGEFRRLSIDRDATDSSRRYVRDAGHKSVVISGDGRYVYLESTAPHADADQNDILDLYRYDIAADTIELISADAMGNAVGTQDVSRHNFAWLQRHPPLVADDDSFTVFAGESDNFGTHADETLDLYRHDTATGAITALGAREVDWFAFLDGEQAVQFTSYARDLIAGETNPRGTVYRLDLSDLSISKLYDGSLPVAYDHDVVTGVDSIGDGFALFNGVLPDGSTQVFTTLPPLFYDYSTVDYSGGSYLTVDVYELGSVQDFLLDPASVNAPPELLDATLAIDENAAADTVAGQVAAVDDGSVRYRLVGGSGAALFTVDAISGSVAVAAGAMLDHEADASHTLLVQAIDDGPGRTRADLREYTVAIGDVNESPTVADATTLVSERAIDGATLGTLAIDDPDGDAAFAVTLAGVGHEAFAVSSDGTLVVADASRLDFESQPSYSLSVVATDADGMASAAATLEIEVLDRNDRPTLAAQSFEVSELAIDGAVVGQVAAADDDAGQSLTYEIINKNFVDEFTVDAATGRIVVADASRLDYERRQSYAMRVRVTDSSGTGNASTSALVTIAVLDRNDRPIVRSDTLRVSEHAIDGAVVGQVRVDDADAGQTWRFEIINASFRNALTIDAETGVVRVGDGRELDHERRDTLVMRVLATDSSGATNDRHSALVYVDVLDRNDRPTLRPQTIVAPADAANGDVIGTVIASDQDAGQSLSYAIVSSTMSGASILDDATGAVTLVDAAAFRSFAGGSIELEVEVSDDSGAANATWRTTVRIERAASSPVFVVGRDDLLTGLDTEATMDALLAAFPVDGWLAPPL